MKLQYLLLIWSPHFYNNYNTILYIFTYNYCLNYFRYFLKLNVLKDNLLTLTTINKILQNLFHFRYVSHGWC